MAIKFSGVRSPSGSAVCLNIFKDTVFHRPAFIRVSSLEEYFKYGVTQFFIKVEYWDEDKVLKASDLKVRVDDLLRECIEVQEYAQKYFPEYAV